MRILFLSPRQPLPARSGAKLREYHFLRALGAGAEVSYAYFADPAAQPLTTGDLPFCREVIGVPKPPSYGLAKTVKGMLGPWPLPILNYTSAAMTAVVARLMNMREFDIIHLDSIHMIRYAQEATARNPRLKAVYDWHNIESEAMRRYSAAAAGGARAWYARLTATKLEVLEKEILRSARGHVVCSAREQAQLRRIWPAAAIEVVENGVDTRYFAMGAREPAIPRQIVFVGAMDYFPNSDAASFFANRIWPQVRKHINDAELLIVGANPGPAVLALGGLPGVKVTGMVPDVRPFYREAIAAIVPLRSGSGTRLKILEAMAAGVPVVSTPLGAEGLEVVGGKNILLVDPDDTDGWAAQLASLSDSHDLRARLTAAGHRLVENLYDWEILGAKLRRIYQAWFSGDEPPRER